MKLADMLAEAPSMPTSVHYVCLDGEAIAQIQLLQREQAVIRAEAAQAADSGITKARKASEGAPRPDPRIAALDKRLDELDDRRRSRSGDLTLRAGSGGEWTRWMAEHPAREDNALDENVALGYCNAEDLIEDLGKYVETWDGGEGPETLTKSDWTKLRERLHPKTLHDLATAVVKLHATTWAALPKSQSGSEAKATSATA